MNKPIGGRGKKAPYDTALVRVPVPIKPEIEDLIERYRNSVLNNSEEIKANSSNNEIENCLVLLARFISESGQSEKMHTRNNVNLVKFRDWLRSLNSSTESDTL